MKKMLGLLVAVAAVALASAGAAAPPKLAASATGSGHFVYQGHLRTFSFTAHKSSSGSVVGQMQVNNRATGSGRQHLVVDCLVVVGNTAYMSGQITQSTIAGRNGWGFVVGVQDNGQGRKSAPDKISLIWEQAGAFNCASATDQATAAPIYSIKGGNVTVH